jgi:nitrate/TMAO reductase-like tetraheme cytochrome c subunit
MSADQPDSPRENPEAGSSAVSVAGADESMPSLRWRKLRLFGLGFLTLTGSLVLCVGMLTGSAAWYTSRSQFCSSCHIMDPYYASWQRSSHSDVTCIKCHFAPGIGEKVRGKMQGLVQLTTYITRSEGPRPVGQVEDVSCLRSGCHERRTLPGPVKFEGMIFDHGPHLQDLHVGGDEHRHLAADGSIPPAPDEQDSHHVMKLRCTSCHGQVDQSEHIQVNKATCYLCHFKQGHFNEGLAACTRCHKIPEEQFDLGGGITFTHELVYENGVDCKSCHGDLNRGDGHVARVRCQVCHNRETDLEKIADVGLMHELHVTSYKVDCMDCHEEITHSLAPEKLTHAASDCRSCHPDHHREQVNMLLGTGGLSLPDQLTRMSNSRVQCAACHRERDVSATGTVVWRASADVCTACHSSADETQLQTYQEQVRVFLADLAAALERVRKAMEVAELTSQQLSSYSETLERLEHDLEFLNVGNGIHNIHYASTLTRVLMDDTRQLCRQLNVAEPMAELPQGIDRLD